MSNAKSHDLDRLKSVLSETPDVIVAVSGGVDSLTLAHVAALVCPGFKAIHAKSPAVPALATDRVRRHATSYGWRLDVIDAGEFADPMYLNNPINRCYYCKSNLYKSIRNIAGDDVIVSGANLDDLEDFRPGLDAASREGVLHPFVQAGLDKNAVRRIARSLELSDIAELPAQPCLASRIETGVMIDPVDLAFVDRIEMEVRQHVGGANVRCRITHDGVRLEISEPLSESVIASIVAWCGDYGKKWLGVSNYRRGSAFRQDVA